MVLVVVSVIPSYSQKIRGSRTRTLETLSTKAGILKLIRIDDFDISETNWYATLNGRTVFRTYDDVFDSVTFHTVFKNLGNSEAVLLQIKFNPDTCEFRVINIPLSGKPVVSGPFGFCGPSIMQEGRRITFTFGSKQKVKPLVWIFENGIVKKEQDN